ncbi:neurogenic protein mastermind [Drosophila bipectinata]|uniref:neurogenic protein mastermind n=1 Tax=Drosophila bipectinata TaxID=42026 RepID=UPI001C8AEAB6|nr:RNA polymerase II degradation factor 1 [Drosophila bipectinata]
MFPQAELENYKLQVELLQEKLQRSEDNRQQLEHKLDKILQKRSELDKSMRHKSRQKYQEFLEEQSKRNERNKKLVDMLERIDEQTAAMSQRSERLKMMKLQYQMYFAKLVQNQTLRCIQQTTAPATAPAGGAIPVLLQPQATVVTNPPQPTPQPWTFAMATPTQAGMMLTPQFAPGLAQPHTPTPLAAGVPAHHPVYYPDLFGGRVTPLGTSNLFDLRATLRAFDNENADLPERMQPHLTGDYQAQELGGGRGAGAGGAATSSTASQENGAGSGARQLSSTSSTLATSSLTFDKLPKTSSALTLTELPVTPNAATSAAGATPGAGGLAATSAAGGTATDHDVRGQPQRENGGDLDAWTNSRVTKVEYEKSPTVGGHNEPVQQQQQHDFDAYFGELKIDESWQELGPPNPTPGRSQEDKRPLNVRASEVSAKLGISNDLLDEVKASRAALEKAAAAVDEQLARGNQLSPPVSQDVGNTVTQHLQQQQQTKPGVSIENIENAIYGERLTGTGTETGTGRGTGGTGGAAPPTQGFFENLVTNAPTSEVLQDMEVQPVESADAAGHYGQYDASGYSESSEPIYASIDSNNQQQQQQPSSATVEPLYSEIGNPTDYTQAYATDASATDATAAAPGPATEITTAGAGDPNGEPQEYSNIDYGNYEDGQYAAGYDPNVAYPGYIYDEATGQYIADPNAQQYAPDGSYAGQEYDANAVQNYDYSAYEQQQQQQQEELQQPLQEQQEVYPVAENSQDVPEVQEPSPAVPAAAPATPEPLNSGSTANPKPIKPTSILSTTTDKQAAPNDAQHQQQQQKKKKRVNFVDSSETDDSSSVKPTAPVSPNPGPAAAATPAPANPSSSGGGGGGGGGSESDFDFSTGSETKN